MRQRAAVALLAVAAVWGLVLLAAALTGGWRFTGLTLTSAKPLRFVLLLGFLGWFLLPETWRSRFQVKPRTWLLGGLGFFAAYGALFRITRWLAFDSAAFDLALFESTLHNTLEGRFMYAWGLNRSLFSEHFEPIVLFLLPLYVVVRHPAALLFAQWAVVTLAVVPLYRSARLLGLDRRLASLIGAAYFLSPVVWQANRIDFHPELFAPLAVFWALHASISRRWLSLYAAVAFAFTIKEEMALVMVCFAPLVLKGAGRRWPHALAVGALSLAWAVIAFRWAMPAAHPAGAALHPLAGRWSHLGATYPEMAIGLLTHPGYVTQALFSEPALSLFASLGFVPLLDPVSFVAALPPLLLHLTGSYEFAARLGAYYGLLGACLLFVGLVFGIERANRRWGPRAAFAAGVLSLIVTPTWPFLSRVTAADLHAAAFLRTIDAADSVCAQSPIAPHRTPTERLHMIPYCERDEWLLFAREHDHWPLVAPGEYADYLRRTTESGEYEVAFAESDYVFMRKKR